ncbi:MAG: hypothetical protein A3B99_01840 [Candidatus Yanofskybacteria bacterium RIFCSPHIGHO2_02_FULL_44_12b]|uniref:Uncharacterized protein n=2 Tax=Candidatus Yanofskyibacteriota TaxID=1752733 RepID=A0A1F8GM57_9BACT|nr:MAG: hypothetical protein UW79_C0002G0027 [Candidatus Yanofskybacteria bacterium GW2011_GWA2_44_9]OGN05284.1 MAG: hypothetical protein A2659_05020 [Candidatus Yanofskybacteria bacterium RIFCSPHIGHO2_01_FULL_44_24]OGN14983.1 MAG: hypothetical protein A3B99_01840 [Candidatus Yanofskybacteria bacterium RIFCSPHIGHO2_02_FULL_44_12b]OGN26421.1 MAG: hypothetical protein A2925_03550 [Candidatus Yanofskybacteria bacterium RIFCSPLOWO2_01_FULL_44_22]
MDKPIANPSVFTNRVQNLFTAIFSYHFVRKLVVLEQATPFGTYTSLVFRRADKAPLSQLLKEELIAEPNKIEILVKDGPNQQIDDTDLESVIKSIREEDNTIFILVTSGDVPSDDYDRLFRFFTRHQIIILPLGENDISKLEDFVKNGNINACLVVLCMLTDRITSGNEKLPSIWASRAERQKEAIVARLNKMADLKGPQLRTLIKKLRFLMSFEKSGGEIAKACMAVKISRKTFYLWIENDPVFKKLFETA